MSRKNFGEKSASGGFQNEKIKKNNHPKTTRFFSAYKINAPQCSKI